MEFWVFFKILFIFYLLAYCQYDTKAKTGNGIGQKTLVSNEKKFEYFVPQRFDLDIFLKQKHSFFKHPVIA